MLRPWPRGQGDLAVAVRPIAFGTVDAIGTGAPNNDPEALMAAIAAGSQDAVAALYDRFSPLVHAMCRRILHDEAAAEDLLEDIFIEVWNKRERYDPARGGVATYLATLTRSRAIDRLRAQRRSPATPLLDGFDPAAPASDPARATYDRERKVMVERALAGLNEDQRKAIELAYYDGLSHNDVAERLAKPLGTVKTWIRQGLIRLRDSMRIEEEEAS